ncbi:hypothetical protein ACHAXT_007122 [Thalassiosira profunda]
MASLDSFAEAIAHYLRGNSRLTCLGFYHDTGSITDKGWAAFSSLLCDTSSVDNTYHANHTLKHMRFYLYDPEFHLPETLSSLLALNRDQDKKRVAVKKILRYHSKLDMEPFLEWDLKVLPVAVAWFDRARGYAGNEEGNVDAKKLSSIYQFARSSIEVCALQEVKDYLIYQFGLYR